MARATVDGVTQSMPLAFKITPDGAAVSEAAAVVNSLETDVADLNNEFGFDSRKTLAKVASSTSDGAANATKTSKIVGEAKDRAIAGIVAAFDPASPEVAAVITEHHVLHCANHGLNLLAGACHKHEEAAHKRFVMCLSQIVRMQRQFRATHPPNLPACAGAPAECAGRDP